MRGRALSFSLSFSLFLSRGAHHGAVALVKSKRPYLELQFQTFGYLDIFGERKEKIVLHLEVILEVISLAER